MPDRNLVTDLTAIGAASIRTQMLFDANVGAYANPTRGQHRLVQDLKYLAESQPAAAVMIGQAALGDYEVLQLAVRATRFPGLST